ncbi:MAG TPA: dTDP-4-dehydrorhamnose reductase [Anaerolineales bacterium]|nr:dTDP-4-dehydrorhamnose reductase [Anaerolineales bacterium]
MMRILLLGKYGQLGWELNRSLLPLGEVLALDYPEIDLAADDFVEKIRSYRPQVIINATAYTAVDRAESEPEIAMAINSRAPGMMAQEASKLGAALVHYSTDYVFDGAKGSDYLETDAPSPLGVYGQSKLEGELAVQHAGGAHLILRTSWVYSLRGDSFVTKVLQWARQQATLRVVSDQVGNPTWARMLAEITAQVLAKGDDDITGWLQERRGLYHLAGSGRASRLEWAQAILQFDPRREGQIVKEILPAQTVDFPTPAQRPLHSALNCDKFKAMFNLELPNWREALQLALAVS